MFTVFKSFRCAIGPPRLPPQATAATPPCKGGVFYIAISLFLLNKFLTIKLLKKVVTYFIKMKTKKEARKNINSRNTNVNSSTFKGRCQPKAEGGV
jgi:hypothetical protein